MRPEVTEKNRCHLCGRAFVDGACPVCDRRPRRAALGAGTWLWVHDRRLVAVTVVVVIALAAGGLVVWPRPSPRSSVPPPTTHPDQAGLAGPWLPAASAPASRSVFGVGTDAVDEFGVHGVRGYAFVVSSRDGVSGLLTDYDLIVSSYLTGQRTVYLRYDTQTYAARVVAVSPDPHVALLRLNGTWTPLPVARTVPALGDAVTVGRFTAEGPRRASVIDYTGPGGVTHLTFSVDVPVAEDGAPVLNAAGEVVGVAEPTVQFGPAATGVGFALPIEAVCTAIDALPSVQRSAVVGGRSARHRGC